MKNLNLSNDVKQLLKNDLVPFRDVVLMNDPATECEPAAFHHTFSEELLHGQQHVVIEAFRESAKSSYVLRAFPLHCLAYPSKKMDLIVIIKQNQRLAGDKLLEIENEYRSNPVLQHNLVQIRTATRDMFSVDVKNEAGEIINVVIVAFGKHASIRGLNISDRRPKIIILDDIQDKDDVRSETITAADWDWFVSDVMFLGKSVRLFFIGNNLGDKCVIERCINNAETMGFKAIRIPVVIDGKPAWEARDKMEDIIKERDNYAAIGKLDIWMQEKMCQAVAEENRTFKEEDYRYYSPSSRLDIAGRCNLFACLDPASSLNPESCYRAITLTGVDADNHWFLLDCKYGRWDSAEMIDIIFNMVATYRLQNFYIEKGWWEQVMQPFLTKEMSKRNIFFNVIPLEHGKIGSKLERIKLLQPRFKAHSVYFPDEAEWLGEFKTELAGVTRDAIKSEYIDCVDAFAMTEQVAIAPVNARPSYETEMRRRRDDNSSQSLFSIAGY